MNETPLFDQLAGRAKVEVAGLRTPQVGDTLSPAEVLALPVGSVVMCTTHGSFGVFVQRVWQRYGGEPDWQFGMSRHEWQATDGGFQRVDDAAQPPVFTWNRVVTLLHIGTGSVG